MRRPFARSFMSWSVFLCLDDLDPGGIVGGLEAVDVEGVEVEELEEPVVGEWEKSESEVEESGESVDGVPVVVARTLLVGWRARIVGKIAILLTYVVVAVNEDPGIREVITKFSSLSIVVLRLLDRVWNAEIIDS